MSFRATLAQLAEVLAATPVNLAEALTTTAVGLTTDTRSLKPGEVFLALQGENFDGHQFVETAIDQGAIAAITATGSQLPQTPQLQVPDTLAAYQATSHWWRHQFRIPIIAVTGSVGKTTTKELIAAVLGVYGPVLKTQANYNNEIGVPKTLLELGPHSYAVIEMGMRAAGEIACLTQIACPDVAVITNVGTAHIGRLGSRQAIAQAKCELLAAMSPTGVAVLNADDPLLLETAKTVWHGKTLTYGLESGDVHGRLIDDQTLLVEGTEFLVPLPGRHNTLNYLAALAVAKLLHLSWSPLKMGLTVNLPKGRAQRYEFNNVVILDETYNAGPESMLAALNLLAQTSGQRHIAVLGAMKELGEHSLELHQQIGRAVQELNLNHLLVLVDSPEAAAITAGVAESLEVKQFSTHEALIADLQAFVQPGDRLLFKASHSVGLDRVVEKLRAALLLSEG